MTDHGYCPKCGARAFPTTGVAPGVLKCEKGHKFPDKSALETPDPVPMFEDMDPEKFADGAGKLMAAIKGETSPVPDARQIVAVGNNPILQDVAYAHEPLVAVRTAVAQAMAQVHPDRTGVHNLVFAVSIVSAGPDIADQLVVFSPGGGAQRNAKELLTRLRLAGDQLERLIDSGAFDG